MKNYYEILEVSEKASIEVIEKAYKTLAKKYHPDREKNISVEEKNFKEKKMKEINEAYAVLSSEFLREQYDNEIKDKQEKNLKNEFKEKDSKEKSKDNTQRFSNTTTFENIVKICKDIFSNRPKLKDIKQMNKNDYLSIGLTVLLMIIILVILWFIPFTKPFISSIIGVFN